MVFEGVQPAVFADLWHLNKVPTKIQSLSLLIGSGSGRQHECWLFWFQWDCIWGFFKKQLRSTALPKAKGTKGVLFSSRKSSCPTPASSNQPSSRESVWHRKFLIAFQIYSLVEPLRFCLSLWTINPEKWALVYFTASHRTLWQRLTVIRNFLVYKTLSPLLSFLSPATTLGSEHWLQTVQWLGREA